MARTRDENEEEERREVGKGSNGRGYSNIFIVLDLFSNTVLLLLLYMNKPSTTFTRQSGVAEVQNCVAIGLKNQFCFLSP